MDRNRALNWKIIKSKILPAVLFRLNCVMYHRFLPKLFLNRSIAPNWLKSGIAMPGMSATVFFL